MFQLHMLVAGMGLIHKLKGCLTVPSMANLELVTWLARSCCRACSCCCPEGAPPSALDTTRDLQTARWASASITHLHSELAACKVGLCSPHGCTQDI